MRVVFKILVRHVTNRSHSSSQEKQVVMTPFQQTVAALLRVKTEGAHLISTLHVGQTLANNEGEMETFSKSKQMIFTH